MTEFLQATLGRFFDALKPEQVCWLCIVLTIGGITYGVRTFAGAEEVQALSVQIDEQRAFDLRAEQCRAIKEGHNAARYTLELQQVLARYREVSGDDYRLPHCEELL